MSKPQVTITLGRSGRKVVKRPETVSDRSRTDSQPLSGGKRSTSDRVRGSGDGSWLPTNKRLRGGFSAHGPGYNRVHGAQVGRNDLRLKLMRKELLKQKQREVQTRKNMELREGMSKNVPSNERNLLRSSSYTNREGEIMQMEASRKSYPFYTRAALKPSSPERVVNVSREMPPPRNIDELRQVPSRRPSDASRTAQIFGNDALNPTRTTGPTPITMRSNHDAGKPITGPPRASGFPSTSFIGEPPLTVGSLLHSLGLGKYAILFQAEEVDMAALKQMRDNDLKELGIPMGPRKKILLALLSFTKRQSF